MNKIIVFTDLDGTFLDHHTYSYDEALPALNRLQDHDIPVIPVTSKTLAEINALALPFGNGPKVAENGMVAQYDDKKHCHQDYESILTFINAHLPPDIREHFIGFNDLSIDDIARHTALPAEKAALAKNRQASEPFLWTGSDDQYHRLENLASENHLSLTRGGRFHHLMGQGGKDHAVKEIIQYYKHLYQTQNIISIALGDGPNDAQMLAGADYGVQIPNKHGVYFDIENPKGSILQAQFSGPKGWSQAMNKLLDQLLL